VQKTPEQWLEQAAPEKKSGIFKVFLGYAPGVGKTYNMLSEAIRRSGRGEDVVIGVVETHGRKGVAELIGQLPVVPRRQLEYKGTKFEEMDVDASTPLHSSALNTLPAQAIKVATLWCSITTPLGLPVEPEV